MSPRLRARLKRGLVLTLLGIAVAAGLVFFVLPLEPPEPAESVTASLPPPLSVPYVHPAPEPVTLVPAPQPGLVEKSADGLLPVISPTGREAWQVYARPFDAKDPRPRVAIVISGLGLSRAPTEQALRELPPAVTLSFLPDAPNVSHRLEEARRLGHETLLDLSLEPAGNSREYAGPRVLLTSLEPSQNLARLRWIMGRGTGYIGMMTYVGSGFASSPAQLRPILAELKRRGLAFVDAEVAPSGQAMQLAAALGLPRGSIDSVLDAEISPATIEEGLNGLAHLARRHGTAIGIGNDYPQTVATVAAWAKSPAARSIVLAPISAVLAR